MKRKSIEHIPHWVGDMLWEPGAVPLIVHRWIPERTYPEHDHDFLELVLVMEGGCRHSSVLGTQTVQKGDLILLRPGTWHALEDPRPMDIWQCFLGAALLQHELLWTRHDPLLASLLWGVGPGQDIRGVNLLSVSAATLNQMGTLFQRMLIFQQDACAHRAARVGLLLQVLDEVASCFRDEALPAEDVSPVAILAAESLQKRPSENWCLDHLARELNVNKFHLARQFRAGLGVSPMAYLNRLRAEQAAALVRNTSLPLSEIGVSVGWPVSSHFSRRFRQHLGMSAQEYRRRFSG